MYKYPPPPPSMGSLTDMWGTPPPHFAKFSSALFVFYLGYPMPLDLIHC